MESSKKTLVLIDAHAVLHRAFHALPNFTSPSGESTGALYGFSAFLLKIIRELNPDYIAACYDLSEPTFRHAAYEKYKAHRPKTDDTLVPQISRSHDILKAFNIPIFEAKGFEADDIIGTIVDNLKSQISNLKIIVASGDLDTLQLVRNDDVVVYTLSKGIKEAVIYNEDAVFKRFGFVPTSLPDFKGLKGDPSDNIIGLKGIGEKTAGELIKNFATIENLYEKLKQDEKILKKAGIKDRTIKILREGEEEAIFSKTLAEIRRDAPIEFLLEDSDWKEKYDESAIKKIFTEFGFRSLIERLPESKSSEEKSDPLEKIKAQVPEKFFREIEMPLSKILKEMTEQGILLDIKYLEELSKKYHKNLDELEQKIYGLAGEKFNINSPQQISSILFEKLLPRGQAGKIQNKRLKKTKTGAYSTNISELAKLRDSHPIVNEIISYREFAKLISTYVDALPKLADKKNRLHTTFDQSGAVTGRISSKEPNLQNIPKKTELGRNIRRAFIADKNFQLASFDYSQIELRVLAILSRDPKLAEVFKKGKDVHNTVASEVFHVKPEEVTNEMRRKAKIINFGIIYGMGVNSLRAAIGCSSEEARIFYDEYFAHFKGVAEYIEKTKQEVYERGYTETLFGRKRFFPEIKSPEEYARKEAERMAINAPIQGTAADFIKIAMVKAEEKLKEKGLKEGARLLLQIHDELLYEIKDEIMAETIPLIAGSMESVYQDDIPIRVNIFAGKNWEDMVEYK